MKKPGLQEGRKGNIISDISLHDLSMPHLISAWGRVLLMLFRSLSQWLKNGSRRRVLGRHLQDEDCHLLQIQALDCLDA